MPNIYDNTEDRKLADAIRETLRKSQRADFCVGYFNLRGWRRIVKEIDALPRARELPPCRLIVGMRGDSDVDLRKLYAGVDTEITQQKAFEAKKEFARALRQQLTWGTPTLPDERALCKLAKQLRAGVLQVKFFGAYPLHAKLYLAHHEDGSVTGYVGSSNLTLAGLENQGELNLDVLDRETTEKLTEWFEERWEHLWCLDISKELADIIQESWAGGPIDPYEIYIKTAYELSREAMEGAREFRVPKEFDDVLAEFQKLAVSLAAERLNRHGGVMISDVVGLGKTLVACAIAKIYQERGGNLLVICPPKIQHNWEVELEKYDLLYKIRSHGMTHALPSKRYKLVVIDESHNFRNRETQRWVDLRKYIVENESLVILLTATPYNTKIEDIGNQLRLFLDHEKDLNISPEKYIREIGGKGMFLQRHTSSPIQSLAAFERSRHIDDWRNLMRQYLVRRTRTHIKNNYAEYDDERGRHYFVFGKNKRQYFPHRKLHNAEFGMDESQPDDDYAALYSNAVVDIINQLHLPRYGIRRYRLPDFADGLPAEMTAEEEEIDRDLNRAGERLRGFARSGLFKRLESSGQAFLYSIRRHIMRNAIYLAALNMQDGKFPIGSIVSEVTDLALETEGLELLDDVVPGDDLASFLHEGKLIYDGLRKRPELQRRFGWIRVRWFNMDDLRTNLERDNELLMQILALVPVWRPENDRKLKKLFQVCTQDDYVGEKILIFTQFKDTAEYLCRELKNLGIDKIEIAHGGKDNIETLIAHFSPKSNGKNIPLSEQVRVLISTDALSEGQNLQDAHIVVNFDLPWAIIRLIQRVGRVDRIGQESEEINCICFMPEAGIDRIIRLRQRLNHRMTENAELVGSDERFFEGNRVNLKQIYEETLNLEQESDDTDLVSRAHDIYTQAVKQDPALEARIKSLPDVVYSVKRSPNATGALAYIKTGNNQHILAHIDQTRAVVSQSQSKILDMLACKRNEPKLPAPEEHHSLVEVAVQHARSSKAATLGGQLGGAHDTRYRVYQRLIDHYSRHQNEIIEAAELKDAIDLIYDYPLKDTAIDSLFRQLKSGIDDHDLTAMVCALMASEKLCALPKPGTPSEPQIVCSMGLVKN